VIFFAVVIGLTPALAGAFDSSCILDAKLRAAGGVVPCLLRGTVTARVGSEEFYVQDESSGVRVVSASHLPDEGDLVETEGWLYLGDSGEFQMRSSKVRRLGHGPPVQPRLLTLPDAYAGGYQGQLLAVRGAVLNVNFGNEFDSISIQAGRSSLRVFYPANHRGLSAFEPIYPGMQVAVTGISVPQTADPEFDGYQVRLRGPADLGVRPALDGSRSSFQPWAGTMAALLLAGAGAWMWFRSHPHGGAAPTSQVQ
jgi:hypothetical protein